ncbi:MAG: long-chain fatty acid--CoA ligase, partial [Actinomycetota bacterium]|nr:long-chain fatty acid--CoA ligase [Actinomycetota bacterium]
SWRSISFREFDETAREVAHGLLSLGLGKGDFVSLLSSNRPEWHIADVAVLMCGGATVPVYITNSPPQVAHVVGHSESTIAIVEDDVQLAKIMETLPDLPKLKTIVVIEPGAGSSDERVLSLDKLRESGRRHAEGGSSELEERIKSIKPEDLATVVYTSGTTGPPKGVMLTHGGFAWTLHSVGGLLGFRDCEERMVSYLPLSHIFERLASDWGGICFGFEIWFSESVDKLRENLKECEPTFFVGVPRVYEKFYSGVKGRYETHEKKELIAKAVKASLERVELQQAGKPVPLGLRLKCKLFDKLIFSKTRHELGMRHCRFAITGAAPIMPEVIKFIHALGIDLVEAYGQTETNAPTAVTPPGKARIGTVGPPIPGLELKFDEEGEILVRGPNVFKGYYKDPEATAEAFTEDGFLRTGDLGELDDHGYLRITDRKKDIIITAGGKNIAPQEIEGRLKTSPLISQAVIIGDGRPFVSALLTLDADAVTAWAKERGVEFGDVADLSADTTVLKAIEAEVERVNESLARAEQIKRWTVLPHDFTQDAEEITPTLKVRRKTITERYGDVIESMYVH